MPLPKDINEYLRAWAPELGERILQTYPPLQGFDDAASPLIGQVLRKPFPAQTLAIMGVVKRWNQARGAAVIAEGFGGRGGGAADAGAPATAGARWAAGAGALAPAAGGAVAPAEFPTGATMAVSRPMSGTIRTRTMPRSATYSNSVSAILSMWSADSDGATSTSSA